jgi:hypothetical protein
MNKEEKAVLPKNIVKKWIESVMQHQYDITVHAKDSPFPEKFVRSLIYEGWSVQIVNENRLIVTSNDPLKLADLSLRLRKMGFLVTDSD